MSPWLVVNNPEQSGQVWTISPFTIKGRGMPRGLQWSCSDIECPLSLVPSNCPTWTEYPTDGRHERTPNKSGGDLLGVQLLGAVREVITLELPETLLSVLECKETVQPLFTLSRTLNEQGESVHEVAEFNG